MSEDESLQEEEVRVLYRTLMEIKEEEDPGDPMLKVAAVFVIGGPALALLTIDWYHMDRFFVLFFGGGGFGAVLALIASIQSIRYDKRKKNVFSQLVESAKIPKEVTNSVFRYKSREKLVISRIESNYSVLEQQPKPVIVSTLTEMNEK